MKMEQFGNFNDVRLVTMITYDCPIIGFTMYNLGNSLTILGIVFAKYTKNQSILQLFSHQEANES